MIGKPGDGFRIAMSVLDVFRSTVGAAALGFARRALDESVKRAAERKLFGAPMAELQMVQGHIADMALDIDAAALLVYRAAWTKDMGAARVTREAAMAKLFATDRAQDVIDKAVQLHGGDGVRRGHIVESLYREIRALRIYEGASDVQKVVIATAGHGGRMRAMLGPTAHTDTFARDNLPPPDQWPDFLLDGFDYPERLNAGVELTDRMVERGFGDHTALIGNGRRRTYKELADWTSRLAHALVESYGVKPGNRVLIRSANNPGHGRLLAGGDQGRRGGGQHHADAARRRADADRRQGRDRARALRHQADGRDGRLRQGQPLPQAGRRLRRHRQPRCRARPRRARQIRPLRGGRRPAATMSRCSASPPARPACRRPPCISTATC